MAIDIRREKLLTLSGACDWWLARTGFEKAPTTFWRWSRKGVQAADGSRVKLEVIQDGQRLKTSVEALQRLFDRLAAIRAGVELRQEEALSQPAVQPRTWSQAHEAATRELEEAGA
jgi:hypothetical protein